MKSRATLPHLNYDNCKDCASKCEHAGKNREFVYSGERSCKVNGIARKIDREKWEPCQECERRNCNNCEYDDLLSSFEPCKSCYNAKRWKPAQKFCPQCGRPLTEEAWAELERRVFP